MIDNIENIRKKSQKWIRLKSKKMNLRNWSNWWLQQLLAVVVSCVNVQRPPHRLCQRNQRSPLLGLSRLSHLIPNQKCIQIHDHELLLVTHVASQKGTECRELPPCFDSHRSHQCGGVQPASACCSNVKNDRDLLDLSLNELLQTVVEWWQGEPK